MNIFIGRIKLFLRSCLVLTMLFSAVPQAIAASSSLEGNQYYLFDAIDRNDLLAVKQLLQAHPELKNTRWIGSSSAGKPYMVDLKRSHFSPLDEAVWNQKPEIARFLFDSGAELDVSAAVGLGKLDYLQSHLAELTDKGTKPTRISVNESRPPMHWAVQCDRPDVVRWLLNHGVKIDQGDLVDYETPLHRACENGNLQMVILLLANQADISAGGGFVRHTPLHFAARSGNTALVDFLLTKGVDVNITDVGGGTALHVAAGQDNVNMASYLLKHGASIEPRLNCNIGINNGTIGPRDARGETPLYYAAKLGNLKMVRFLVGHKADINARDTVWTVLDVAHEHPDVCAYLTLNGAKSCKSDATKIRMRK